jgi:hypothetical protein
VSVLASDNFNRSGATLGANWTEYGTFSNAWNTDGANAVPDSFGADAYGAYTGVTFPNDQYSQVKVTITGTFGNGQGPGPAVRMGTATPENVYRLCVDHAASNNMELSKFVGGSFTSKWVRSQAFADGDTLYLEVQGTTLVAKLNGTAIGTSVTDSSLGSGRAGIGFSSGTTSSASLDDFEGGDFAGVFDPSSFPWADQLQPMPGLAVVGF